MENEIEKKKSIKREKSVKYPYYDLKTCIDFAKLIDDLAGKGEASISAIMESMGIKSEYNKQLRYKISSSEQFGLIIKSGKYFKITERTRKIFYPTENDPEQLKLEAFQLPPLYKRIIEKYNGSKLPDKLPYILYDWGIARNVIERAAEMFKKSAKFVGVLDENNILRIEISETRDLQEISKTVPLSKRVPTPQVASEGYHDLDLSLSDGQTAKLLIPKNISKQDVEKLKKMLDVLISE